MTDYSIFPFDSYSTDEIAGLFIDSAKVGDTEFVEACREEIQRRKESLEKRETIMGFPIVWRDDIEDWEGKLVLTDWWEWIEVWSN